MHIREQTIRNFTNTGRKANVTTDLHGKTTSCDGMQPTRLNRTTSYLVPHLAGVAANIGTLKRAGAYTLARACASALQLWRKQNKVSQPIC